MLAKRDIQWDDEELLALEQDLIFKFQMLSLDEDSDRISVKSKKLEGSMNEMVGEFRALHIDSYCPKKIRKIKVYSPFKQHIRQSSKLDILKYCISSCNNRQVMIYSEWTMESFIYSCYLKGISAEANSLLSTGKRYKN